MNGKIQKIKGVYPVTRAEAVYVSIDETLSDTLKNTPKFSNIENSYSLVDLPYTCKNIKYTSVYSEGSTIVSGNNLLNSDLVILKNKQETFKVDNLKEWDTYNQEYGLSKHTIEGVVTSATIRSETEGFIDFIPTISWDVSLATIDANKVVFPSNNLELGTIKCNIADTILYQDIGRTEGICLTSTNYIVVSIKKSRLDGNGTILEQITRFLTSNTIKIIRKLQLPIKQVLNSVFSVNDGDLIEYSYTNHKPKIIKIRGIDYTKNNTSVNNSVEYKSYNQEALHISTPCGYNQPYHPTVLYIKGAKNDEGKYTGWNGYKYWMCQTPFPIGSIPYRDRWENPCIYASNDGVNWVVPAGLVNPIDDLTPSEISNKDYFSDPHLVYREDLNRLEVIYRITHVDDTQEFRKDKYPTWILRKTSTNGINWTDREVLINLQEPNTNGVGDMVRSHSVIWKDGKYKMWYVNMLSGLSPRVFVYAESTDCYKWTNKQYCNTKGYIEPWHMDVVFAKGKYHLLNYVQGDNLYYYVSDNGIDFELVKEIIRPCKIPTSYYSTKLYRACMTYNEDIDMWYLYFSAETETDTKLGLMMGKTPETLQVVDGGYVDRPQYFGKGIEIINTSKIKNEIRLTNKGTCIGVDYDTERVYIKKSNGSKFYLE